MAARGRGLFFPNIYIVKLQMTSPDEELVVFQPNFTGMILGWSFLKLAKIIEFHLELWLPWQPIEKNFYKCEFLPKLL